MVDITKMKKALEKVKASTGSAESDVWLSSGNHALNFNLTGDFNRGIPNRRVVLLFGLQGSGKTFIASMIAKQAQDKGYHIVYLDSERSIHKKYMEKIGIDMSEDKFTTVNVKTIEEATANMSAIFNSFGDDDKVCYVIDSLSGMETEAEMENFNKGKVTTDMGLFAKRIKQFAKNINHKISERDNFCIMTSHAYKNQDLKNGLGTIIPSGGEGMIFFPSLIVALSKLKLKEDTDVVGVKITAETTKSRYTQLGRKIRLEVPYDKGVDPIDGLLELAEKAELVAHSKGSSWYSYEDDDGGLVKFQKSTFKDHYLKLFDFDAVNDIIEVNDGELRPED